MKQMFTSATIKLTAWYLAILMAISLLFSVIIYQISSSEVRTRLHIVEEQFTFPLLSTDPNASSYEDFQKQQLQESRLSLFVALLYANVLILVLGGVGSVVMARRTLSPIEEFQEAQARFTSDASHELRTPLAIMKSELEVAARDSKLTKIELRELLESNLEEVNRLSILSDTLLKLSQHSISQNDFTKLRLSKLIKNVLSRYKHVSTERFSVDIPDKLSIEGNEPSITELFTILIDNALRYSPDDSTIIIRAVSKSSIARVSISNLGPGISAIDLPHIFERFYRGEKSRAAHSGGYGLGLSLARDIVLLHNGDISISSSPDKKTTVKVSLKKA